MDFFARSIQGQVPGARIVDRRREQKKTERPTPGDKDAPVREPDADEVLIHLEGAQRTRRLADNTSEESHEDRQEHQIYDRPDGRSGRKPSIDFEA